MVVGVEKRLVASPHKGHEVRSIRSLTNSLLLSEIKHPASFGAESTLVPVKEQALEILVINDLVLRFGLP